MMSFIRVLLVVLLCRSVGRSSPGAMYDVQLQRLFGVHSCVYTEVSYEELFQDDLITDVNDGDDVASDYYACTHGWQIHHPSISTRTHIRANAGRPATTAADQNISFDRHRIGDVHHNLHVMRLTVPPPSE